MIPSPEFSVNEKVIVSKTERLGTIQEIEISINDEGTSIGYFLHYEACAHCKHEDKGFVDEAELEAL